LDIPITEAAAAALADVQTVFKSIFDDTQRGAWNIQFLDKKYPLKNVSNVNPIAINAVIAYWAEDKTVDTTKADGTSVQVSVSLTYIYFMGVVHECKPDSSTEDLFKAFYASIPGNTDKNSTASISKLETELKKYAESGWKTAFSFDYGSAPPDRKGTSGFVSKDFVFRWLHIPTKKEIQDHINEWYKRDQTSVFQRCGDEIYDDLVDRIFIRAGPDTAKVDFDWQQDNLTTQYTFVGSDSNKTTHTLKEYALFSFAYGKMTEDGDGGNSHEAVIMSVLVCVCVIVTKAASDDEL